MCAARSGAAHIRLIRNANRIGPLSVSTTGRTENSSYDDFVAVSRPRAKKPAPIDLGAPFFRPTDSDRQKTGPAARIYQSKEHP